MATSTTTQVAQGESIHDVLQACNVHHTGTEEDSPAQEAVHHPRGPINPPANASSTTTQEQHREWQVEAYSSRRRVPGYRETNRSVRSARPAGTSSGEEVIVGAMFLGVWVIAGVNRVWRATGGRLNDRIFRYEVGGEW
ncbi:hypothetical protein CLAIMM_09943 [Cladophialophora immunda]|nr:hypothetical protein CLAIMM_09943 [Cladophialophora immunda]